MDVRITTATFTVLRDPRPRSCPDAQWRIARFPMPILASLLHRIEQPQRVLLATGEPPPLEVVYDIEDGEQHQWLIRLERPPALPGA
jgi:hypothetical protein